MYLGRLLRRREVHIVRRPLSLASSTCEVKEVPTCEMMTNGHESRTVHVRTERRSATTFARRLRPALHSLLSFPLLPREQGIGNSTLSPNHAQRNVTPPFTLLPPLPAIPPSSPSSLTTSSFSNPP